MKMKKCQIIPIAICLLCVVIFSACGRKEVSDSPLNPPPDPTIIQGLEASILERTDGIEIRWYRHTEANRYWIYRSTSRTAMGEGIGEINDIQYLDIKSEKNPLKEETPYYYRVTWVNADTAEFGQDIIPVMGVFSSVVDELEPNNRFEKPKKLDVGREYDSYICAFIDGGGEVAIDEDWYVYEREEMEHGSLSVVITLPDDSPFIGHLKLWFYHQDGISWGDGDLLSVPSKMCVYPFPPDVSKVYFRIAPVGIAENIGIGSYKIQLFLR